MCRSELRNLDNNFAEPRKFADADADAMATMPSVLSTFGVLGSKVGLKVWSDITGTPVAE